MEFMMSLDANPDPVGQLRLFNLSINPSGQSFTPSMIANPKDYTTFYENSRPIKKSANDILQIWENVSHDTATDDGTMHQGQRDNQ